MTDSKHNSQLSDIDETLIEARQLVESGKHRQARDLLRQIGKADPNNDEVFLLFAQAASKNEQAIYCLNRALEINPASEPARRLLDSLQSPAIPTDHHPDEQTEPVREASSVENGSSQQTGIENSWSKEDGLRPEKRQSEGRSRLKG
jgi:thioredoxin-like negative regulator of GroEL